MVGYKETLPMISLRESLLLFPYIFTHKPYWRLARNYQMI